MKVQLTTSMGVITLSLNQEKAPLTVENFVKYVNAGYYNGTIFHRVINDFMVQGGGMDAQMNSKPSGAPIKNEANNGLAIQNTASRWPARMIRILPQRSFLSM
jgi:cyclophilin family peptidyl-prolyl cis-trans isomerase